MFKNMRVICKGNVNSRRGIIHSSIYVNDYDENGNLIFSDVKILNETSKVVLSKINEFRYDEFNNAVYNKVSEICLPAIERTITNEYDENNHLIRSIDSDGYEIEYRYDDRGRIIYWKNNEEEFTSYMYVGDSNSISSIVYNRGVVNYKYDSNGKCICNSYLFNSEANRDYEINMKYNKNGDVIEEDISNGPTITYDYEYDEFGRKISVVDSNGERTTWEYIKIA